jgi:hypothetical protein
MTVARNLRNKHNATLTERRYKKKGAATARFASLKTFNPVATPFFGASVKI